MANSAYVEEFNNYEDLLKWRLSEPNISNLTVITHMVGERTKRRLIMGCLMSDANGMAVQKERIQLPRIAGLIYDVLAPMEKSTEGEQIYFLVLDFVEASFRAPLCREERQYCVIKYRG